MELIRAEKLIFVLPLLSPQKYAVPELIDDCVIEEVPNKAVNVWKEGFKPVFIFATHSNIGTCAEIPMLRRRWRALAKDTNKEEIDFLEQHLSLDVARGLAGRDLLLVEDGLRAKLLTLVQNDYIFQQLESGVVDITQLELIDHDDYVEYEEKLNGNTFYAKWVLDPRIVLSITLEEKGSVLISCKTPEALIPPKKLIFGKYEIEFNQSGSDLEYAIELTISEHGRLIVDLAKKLHNATSEISIIRTLAIVLFSYLGMINEKVSELKTNIIEWLQEIAWKKQEIGLIQCSTDMTTSEKNYTSVKGDEWCLRVFKSTTEYMLLNFDKETWKKYEGNVICLRNKNGDVIITGIVKDGRVRSDVVKTISPPLSVEFI